MCKEVLIKKSSKSFSGVNNQTTAMNTKTIPCDIGEHFWQIIYPYDQPPSILEVEVTNFRTYGEEHIWQIGVKPVVDNESTWMFRSWVNYDSELLFKNREAAENGLLLTKLSYNDKINR